MQTVKLSLIRGAFGSSCCYCYELNNQLWCLSVNNTNAIDNNRLFGFTSATYAI